MARPTIRLFYWPGIQGRGEFVRLLLEDAGAAYEEVGRGDGGIDAIMRFMGGEERGALPFAPPFVVVGRQVVSQTANVLAFLAARLGLPPRGEAARFEAQQVQLTIADYVGEVHDVHHPIAGSLYYADQKPEAKRRAELFLRERLPRHLGWLDDLLARNGGRWLVGRSATYADLSAFQVVAGTRYAFPNAMARLEGRIPRLCALHDRVAERPRLAAYLASERRLPFNEDGIFRHYPELDAAPARRAARSARSSAPSRSSK